MARKFIELMDDMHLSSQDLFLRYYQAMQSNNVSAARTILSNDNSLADQITNAENVNKILTGVYERELEPKNDIDYFLTNLEILYNNMILNTKIIGEWDNNTQYQNHNFVYYNDKLYMVYTTELPPIGTLPTDTTYWREYDIKGFKGYGGINLNFQGNWNGSQDYSKDDVVVYKNKLWYAIADNNNYEPNLNHYPWVIITMPQLPNKTPIQADEPEGYNIGDFWWQITQGEEVITTTWGVKENEITPRFASSAFAINNNIYVVGGRLANFNETNINESYDTGANIWETKTAMPTTRSRAAGFSIGTNGYVVGGIDNEGNILATNECYDSITDTWSAKANLPIPMITSAVIDNGKAYVIGGETTNNGLIGNSYVYDPVANTWTAIASKPTLTHGHIVVAHNSVIYAIGGIDTNENTLSIVEAYDIKTDTWSTKSSTIISHSYAGAFVKNNEIYVVGGLDSNWYSIKTVEKYNIGANTWTIDMPINYPRSSLNVLSANGYGYAIGGVNMQTSSIKGYTEKHDDVDLLINFEMVIDTTKTTTVEDYIVTQDNSNIVTEGENPLITEESGTQSSENLTVSIPTTSTGEYNFNIDWGDGTVSSQITTYDDPEITHTYAQSGQYNIKLAGKLTELKFGGLIAKYLTNVVKCDLKLESISSMFSNCRNLQSVPSNIFANATRVTSAYGVFSNCTNLKTIPVNLFINNSQITDFSYAFSNSGINVIPTGLFSGNGKAQDFANTFKDCTSIIAIPATLFSEQSQATTFEGTFDGCTGIKTIPNRLFANNPLVVTYKNVFRNCSGVTEITKDIFGDTIPSVTNMEGAFMGTSITTIPNSMFADAPLVTNYNNVFNGTNIDIIPINCFAGGNNATSVDAFDKNNIIIILDNALQGLLIESGYLSNMTELSYIGNDVFNSNLTTLENMFNGDTALTTIGNINASNVTSTEGAFTGCTALKEVQGFFQDVEHLTSDYPTLKVSTSFADCTNIDHESLLNIINSLVTLTEETKQTLTLSAESLALLNDAEKLVVINKYWELANYTIPTITEDLAKDLVLKMYGLGEEYSTELAETTDEYYGVDLKWTDDDKSGIINSVRYRVNRATGIVTKQEE